MKPDSLEMNFLMNISEHDSISWNIKFLPEEMYISKSTIETLAKCAKYVKSWL